MPRFTGYETFGGNTERFNKQELEILYQLGQGPRTNARLAQVALKYTSRISDLRKKGYNIQCRRLSGGLTEYTLR